MDWGCLGRTFPLRITNLRICSRKKFRIGKKFKISGTNHPEARPNRQMNARPTISFTKLPLLLGLLVCGAVINSRGIDTNAVIWDGPDTNFDQSVAASDVVLAGKVVLTRAGTHCLYNSVLEAGAEPGCPADTEWAFDPGGNITDATNQNLNPKLDFEPLYSYRVTSGGNLSSLLAPDSPNPGPFMIVHLINEHIYFSVTFTAWPQGGGAFAYTRSTPAAVAPPPPPTPSVTITNPANNAVFAAPAEVNVLAGATVSSGSVTNVSFFVNGSLIGSSVGNPFAVTTADLNAGSYAFTAVATAAGISATSSVVNISVVNPVATSLAVPSAVNNNEFSFNYSVN